ncbi:MAG: UDP-N-acetylglucosamine 1-carboxyvinyltransferase [bacterium]|nr:UDP-N-acetylglucosamine 1-carboxyvinyltransferase [bacterium]
MEKFVIKGGNRLEGSIKVDGSKNAALPIILGTLMIPKGESVIRNVPPLRDIFTAVKVMEYVGAKVSYDPQACVMTIDAGNITENTAPYELMRQMRASFLVLGPLLVRCGEARVSLPGGCSLGSRPVDFHIKAFGDLGAEISEESGYVIARAKKLHGGMVYFDRPSHTGTENILYGAITAKEQTIITNAACDPEIIDVANFLNKAGAKITGAGTPTIVVEPVQELKAVDYTVSGDRLVAGTLMMGAAITGGKVEVSGLDPDWMSIVCLKLLEMGCDVSTTDSSISVAGPRDQSKLYPVNVTTFPYPGFPTDLQACIMAVACLASGTSYIKETVFVDRFVHTMELRRLGADVSVSGAEAVIQGVKEMTGAAIMAPDIRAGAGLVLACLAAKGTSELLRIYHVDRGYHRLEEKLNQLGADIKRMQS